MASDSNQLKQTVTPPKGHNDSSDDQAKREDQGRFWTAVVSAVTGVGVFFLFLSKIDAVTGDWRLLGIWFAAVLLAGISVAIMRVALAPLTQRRTSPVLPSDPAIAMRNKMAPVIVIIGAIGIVVLAATIVVAFYLASTTANGKDLINDLDTLLIGIFSAVLPVFATWVGTIIAFYFTESAYSTVSQAVREATSSEDSGKPRVSSVMKDYRSINKIEVNKRTEANDLNVKELQEQLFDGDATVGYIFEGPKQNPIFVIKKKFLEKLSSDPATTTVTDYRKQEGVDSDSTNMLFVKETDTLEGLKRLFAEDEHIEDAFVTRNGQRSETVVGWVRRGSL